MLLNTHTYYSLRYGTLSPSALAERAAQLGYTAMALTDINNTSCMYEFVRCCEKAGIQPAVGLEFRQDGRCLYIGLARNREGLRELNQLLSAASLSGRSLPEIAPPMEHAYIIYPRLIKPIQQFREEEFLGIRPEHVARLFGHELLGHKNKLVALSPVFFADNEGFELHRLLRAIDENTLLSKLTHQQTVKASERLMPPEQVRAFYNTQPYLTENAERLLQSCSIDFQPGLHLNRQSFTGSKAGDYKLLEKLALNGCERRYAHLGFDTQAYRDTLERVKRELRVIEQQDFCPYFLITWDIVRYAESAGYHHVGRGSGANSIVAYCLRITDVDPMELGLYFERFINPHRTSPPDFDIDFSWDERDDVTDYIFKRYGRDYTALLATYSTFKGRSIVRELGKVYGLPKGEIDKIAAAPGEPENHHELAGKIIHYGRKLEGFPNHLSIHAGGVVISEQPIYYHTALQLMPKGFPITHFDMYHGEDLGFHKFDVLSQRGLGHIKDAVDLIRQNQGKAVDIHNVPHIKADERVKAQLRSGDCMGCFYIESPAMRGLLKKLHCDNYIHLVAASSIIRPGVAKSGMMKEYIRRFHNPNSFEYLHPVFEEQLGETFGVMVYQEDVMKIVHHFAGLGLDESDVLRRIMSGKKSKGDTFERLRRKYFDNCRARGHSVELAKEVWRQVESFSGYSFCKAHSASFAVESFQSLYLKAYFPLEFIVAVINNFGGFYQSEYYFHEARRCGGRVHAPCINHSQHLTTLEGTDIYIGFVHLHQMEQQVAHRIVYQRARGGPFRGLSDFLNRVEAGKEQVDLLIRIGAFRFTGQTKQELMWERVALFQPPGQDRHSISLFPEEDGRVEVTARQFLSSGMVEPHGPLPNAIDEMELLGFPLCAPFELLDKQHLTDTISQSARLSELEGRMVRMLGYYVCKKEVRTSNGKIMAFGCWIGQDGHFFDTVHFPPTLKRSPFRGKGMYKIEGKVVKEFGFPSLEVFRMSFLGWGSADREG
jgi:DNA polymerase-3 subunit alpha